MLPRVQMVLWEPNATGACRFSTTEAPQPAAGHSPRLLAAAPASVSIVALDHSMPIGSLARVSVSGSVQSIFRPPSRPLAVRLSPASCAAPPG